MTTEKTIGSLWKYQGNYVNLVEPNGCLWRVKLADGSGRPFLVDPEKLVEVGTQEFQNYVRAATDRVRYAGLVSLVPHADHLELVAEEDLTDVEDIFEALEHALSNGWDVVKPEEIGALTDVLILSRDVERNDEGELVKVGTVYWDADYQVEDLLEKLRTTGRARMWAVKD